MNCKPGDLAIVVRPLKYCPEAMGMIVEVLEVGVIEFPEGLRPGYKIRAPRPLNNNLGKKGCDGWVREKSLRPIRDPGPDAVDSLSLRVTHPTKEPA